LPEPAAPPLPLPPLYRPQPGAPAPQPAGANIAAASSAAVGVPPSEPVAAPSFCASCSGAAWAGPVCDVPASTIDRGATSVDAACAISLASPATPTTITAQPITPL
jgi:hypothetical protein